MKTLTKAAYLFLLTVLITSCVKKKDALLTAPTITGFTIPAKTFGDAPFGLTAPTSDSPGAFTYLSTNASVATISGTTVTITGAGSCLITASQAASGSYGAGTTYTTLLVNGQAPTITNFSMPTAKAVGDAFSITAPTSNNPSAFTYNSSNPAVATISGGNIITVRGVGQSIITAYQPFLGNYAGGQITATLTVQ